MNVNEITMVVFDHNDEVDFKVVFYTTKDKMELDRATVIGLWAGANRRSLPNPDRVIWSITKTLNVLE